jgi:hypothetical protein
MATLFVGDVHACADELRDLLSLSKPDRVIFVGDMFNKGPDPDGTWKLIEEYGAEAVLGNHDRKVVSLASAKKKWRAPEAAIEWLRGLPLSLEGEGWLVVHAGIDPVRGLEHTSEDQLLTMRRWPDDDRSDNPFWWELYTGDRLVIYGHDAVRGLQDHRPKTLGLDSGCVYGRRLSGYLLEDDAIVSVPARAVYKEIGPSPFGAPA